MEFIAKLITGRPLITCLVVGVVVMSMWWLKFQNKLNMKWYWAPILSVLVLAVGIAGAKLLALLEVGFDVESAASMRVYGAIFLCPIVTGLVAMLTRRNAVIAFDALTVAALIGGVVVRIHCLIAGCCNGLPITPDGMLHWPLVELEILLDVTLIVFFWNRIYRGKTRGLAYPIFVLIYGIFRFMIEWVRDEHTGEIWIFHMAHIWSILAIIGAAVTICLIKKHQNERHKRSQRRHPIRKETAK